MTVVRCLWHKVWRNWVVSLCSSILGHCNVYHLTATLLAYHCSWSHTSLSGYSSSGWKAVWKCHSAYGCDARIEHGKQKHNGCRHSLCRKGAFPHGATAPNNPGPPQCWGLTITLRHTTLGRTPLDGWSARRRDLHLTIHNTHKRQTFMHTVGFEPTIPVSERPQTHALDRTATGLCKGEGNRRNLVDSS